LTDGRALDGHGEHCAPLTHQVTVVCGLADDGGHSVSHVRPKLSTSTASFCLSVAAVQFVSLSGLTRWLVRLLLVREFTGSNFGRRTVNVAEGFHAYPQSFQAN